MAVIPLFRVPREEVEAVKRVDPESWLARGVPLIEFCDSFPGSLWFDWKNWAVFDLRNEAWAITSYSMRRARGYGEHERYRCRYRSMIRSWQSRVRDGGSQREKKRLSVAMTLHDARTKRWVVGD
jgi:hypothetical protein